jgi:acyl carrier protein
MDAHAASADPLVEQILALFAREARVDRALLQPEARADTLGITSLDLTLALFELEDRFDVQLPDLLSPGSTAPTVGELVGSVVQAIRMREAAAGAAHAAATSPTSHTPPATPGAPALLSSAP